MPFLLTDLVFYSVMEAADYKILFYSQNSDWAWRVCLVKLENEYILADVFRSKSKQTFFMQINNMSLINITLTDHF